MCFQCDYDKLLTTAGLEPTTNRIGILEIVGNSASPLNAGEIYHTISRTTSINRVTVYRILDLLVEKNVVERFAAGDRSFRYGMAPNEFHRPHAHFYCTACKRVECLDPESVRLNTEILERTFPGMIDRMEIRFDGLCKACLKKRRVG